MEHPADPAEEGLGVGSVGLPLGLVLEIVVHALMAEEHVLVTPVGGDHRRLSLHLSDELLLAAKLSRLIHGVDIEESGVLRNGLQVVQECGVVGLSGVSKVTRWYKSQRPREDRRLLSAVLSVHGHIRKTDSLDIVSGSLESELKRNECGIMGVGDVVVPVVLEEVEAVLAIDAVHGDEVGGVDTITKEFDTHAWGHGVILGIDRLGR